MDTASSGKEYDSLTLEEFLKTQGAGESAMATFTVATRAMLGMLLEKLNSFEYPNHKPVGLELREVGALFFLNYCKSGGGYLQMRADVKHGGQYLRIVGG